MKICDCSDIWDIWDYRLKWVTMYIEFITSARKPIYDNLPVKTIQRNYTRLNRHIQP